MSKVTNGILGVIIGDALGLPVQFKERAWFIKHPVTSMMGHGVFNKPTGSWSDDGSLTLALAASLSEGYHLESIMKEFEAWLFYGKYTQEGQAYDMGQTTTNAILNYHRGIPLSKCGGRTYYDNGNGSLMRILPLVFYLRSVFGSDFTKTPEAMIIIHEVSALTHSHELAKMSCGLYVSIANELLNGKDKITAVTDGLKNATRYYETDPLYTKTKTEYSRFDPLSSFIQLSEKDIGSTGFVKDTLEASIWCLLNTESYESAVLCAVNLGHDTDTTAAVTGGLAALAYDQIKIDWLNMIPHKEVIYRICDAYEQSLNT